MFNKNVLFPVDTEFSQEPFFVLNDLHSAFDFSNRMKWVAKMYHDNHTFHQTLYHAVMKFIKIHL